MQGKGRGAELNEDIIFILTQAENGYDDAVKTAVREAGEYAAERKKIQAEYIEKLKEEWHIFEKSENDGLKRTLAEAEHKKETETVEIKRRLKISQENKAEMISERLKGEVLGLYGSG